MQGNESHEATPLASGSGQDPHPEFQLNAKLRAKLENLAQWRLDPSLIEFPRDANDFRGGFATVSRAHLASSPDGRTSEPKVVAVKKLKVEREADLERVLGLALRESEFVLNLSHPNIIKLEGFVEDASKHMIWLVFAWEENGNLRDFLVSGEWEIPERISLLNILVNSKYYAVITDFGSSRRLGAKDVDQEAKIRDSRPEQPPGEENVTIQAVYSASANTITLTCDKYTLRWAAPELLREELPSLACDIWALGWIAYEVMTNTIPFHDVKRDVAVVIRVIQGDLPSITDHARMSLIQGLCSLMAQCWSINPEERPTAVDCVNLISFMPMIVPAPTQAGDPKTSQTRHAGLLLQLGQMYRLQGDYVSASDCFTKALNIYATTEDTRGKADALRDLADVHRFQAEYSRAAGFYSEALQIYTDIGDHRWRAYALCGLGDVHRHLGEPTESYKSFSEALQIYTDISYQPGRGDALTSLAEMHRLRGEYDEAIELFAEGLQLYIDGGFSLGRAYVLWNLGEVHRCRGEYNEAIKFHSGSLQIYTEMGDRSGQSQALWGLAEDHLSREEYGDATSFYSKALQLSTDVGSKYWRANVLLGLAKTHEAQGHRSEATSSYTDASEAYRELGDPERAAHALKKAADLRTEEAA